MSRSSSLFACSMSVLVALALLLTGLLAGPAPRAHAHQEQEVTLFRAEFDNAPLGLLASPLTVETGTVVPQGG